MAVVPMTFPVTGGVERPGDDPAPYGTGLAPRVPARVTRAGDVIRARVSRSPAPRPRYRGSPGSRNHRRLLERTFLSPDSPFEVRLVDASDYEAMVQSIVPALRPSPFGQMHKPVRTPAGDRYWARQFVDIDPDEEASLLRAASAGRRAPASAASSATPSACTSDDEAADRGERAVARDEPDGETASELSEYVTPSHDPEVCYRRIPAGMRPLLRCNIDICALATQERMLCSRLLLADAPDTLAVAQASPYVRLLLHAVARYHGLTTRSATEPSGERVTRVVRPDHWQRLAPSCSLVDLLASRRRTRVLEAPEPERS